MGSNEFDPDAGYNYVRARGAGGFASDFLYEQDMPRRVAAVKMRLADVVNSEVLRVFNVPSVRAARTWRLSCRVVRPASRRVSAWRR